MIMAQLTGVDELIFSFCHGLIDVTNYFFPNSLSRIHKLTKR